MKPRRSMVLLCLLVVGACSSDPQLSPAATEGRELARSSGCTACHGSEGEGRVGPAWVGLAGSMVELEDGSTVVADDAYLRRSIEEPDAELVAGYPTQMPDNTLDDRQIDAVIAYIRELSE